MIHQSCCACVRRAGRNASAPPSRRCCSRADTRDHGRPSRSASERVYRREHANSGLLTLERHAGGLDREDFKSSGTMTSCYKLFGVMFRKHSAGPTEGTASNREAYIAAQCTKPGELLGTNSACPKSRSFNKCGSYLRALCLSLYVSVHTGRTVWYIIIHNRCPSESTQSCVRFEVFPT